MSCVECVLLLSRDCPHCRKLYKQMDKTWINSLRQMGVRIMDVEVAFTTGVVKPSMAIVYQEVKFGEVTLPSANIAVPQLLCHDGQRVLIQHVVNVDEEDSLVRLAILLRALTQMPVKLCAKPRTGRPRKGAKSEEEDGVEEGEAVEEGGEKRRRGRKK